jgi:DNA-binding phage protein
MTKTLRADAATGVEQMRMLDLDDVVCLLRSEVNRAGGQAAWAKATGVNRVLVNRALSGQRPPTKKMINALGLRPVFVRATPARSR